jgi:hypothetical protein
MMTKTTTTATFPQSKNCCSPSYKSRALQRRIEAQTRRAELRRQLQRRGVALPTRAGQHQAKTLPVAQVSARTTPSVVEIDDQFLADAV